MEMWLKNIRSGVSDEFIAPFPIVKHQPVEVAVKMSVESPVLEVLCHAVRDGKSHFYPTARHEEGSQAIFTAEIPPANEARWFFSFQIRTEDDWYFVTRRGVQGFHPNIALMHCLDTDIVLDDWVPGSTFYQIFPDRFRKGDPNIGVKQGEYEFDGHRTIALDFSSTPPSYDEGHCLDFYNGDLKGIGDSIEHFKQLGITALYLNPIFSACTNHRYDCTDFFHVDDHLGGDSALATLSSRLHEAGIRLMLDISINHSGAEHPWFKTAQSDPDSTEARYYYRDERGNMVYWEQVHTLPQLNYSSSGLRELMYRGKDSVVRRFLRAPFSVDAWRFDVGTDTGRYGEDQLCREIWKEVRLAVKEENPQTYIIGEAWEDASAYVQGDQWDSAMNYFGSGRLLRRWYGQRDTYLMSEWGHSDETGRALTGKELSEAIEQHLASIPDQLVSRQFNLIDSHDTMRLHNHTRIFDWNLYEGIVMLLYVMPGVPSIYYGDEVALDGTMESNEGARYPMQWNREKWDDRFFSLYCRLGALRKDSSLLAHGTWHTEWYDDTTVVFSRIHRKDGLLLVLNRSLEDTHLTIDLSHRHIRSMYHWMTKDAIDIVEGTFYWDAPAHTSGLFMFSMG